MPTVAGCFATLSTAPVTVTWAPPLTMVVLVSAIVTRLGDVGWPQVFAFQFGAATLCTDTPPAYAP